MENKNELNAIQEELSAIRKELKANSRQQTQMFFMIVGWATSILGHLTEIMWLSIGLFALSIMIFIALIIYLAYTSLKDATKPT